jgi:hypothetical protein
LRLAKSQRTCSPISRPSSRPPERNHRQEGHAAAIRHITDFADVPGAEARSALEAIEAQPTVVREVLLRRFIRVWLEE